MLHVAYVVDVAYSDRHWDCYATTHIQQYTQCASDRSAGTSNSSPLESLESGEWFQILTAERTKVSALQGIHRPLYRTEKPCDGDVTSVISIKRV